MTSLAKAKSRTSKIAGSHTRVTKRRMWLWWLITPAALIAVIVGVALWKWAATPPAPTEPPEATRILSAQESTKNFGILIPAYLPKAFNRAGVEIAVSQGGPAGEPQVDLAYRTSRGASLFIRQWVPANPELETLSGSRPIQTKWGKGWLLTQGKSLIAVWVDVGPLRVSLSTHNIDVLSREQLVMAANTLGLASDLQVYSFATELPVIKDVTPPPPFEVPVNSQGVQEFNLTITPGGYSPMRIAVKKDIPVRLVFRAIGQVGCGNALTFPSDPANPVTLELKSETDVQVLEFSPQSPGDFRFFCPHNTFRGILTVRE